MYSLPGSSAKHHRPGPEDFAGYMPVRGNGRDVQRQRGAAGVRLIKRGGRATIAMIGNFMQVREPGGRKDGSEKYSAQKRRGENQGIFPVTARPYGWAVTVQP